MRTETLWLRRFVRAVQLAGMGDRSGSSGPDVTVTPIETQLPETKAAKKHTKQAIKEKNNASGMDAVVTPVDTSISETKVVKNAKPGNEENITFANINGGKL